MTLSDVAGLGKRLGVGLKAAGNFKSLARLEEFPFTAKERKSKLIRRPDRDVPPHETNFVKDAPGPAPYESKAIGEHSTSPTAAAIANGIYDATGDTDQERRPITAESIYRALKKDAERAAD